MDIYVGIALISFDVCFRSVPSDIQKELGMMTNGIFDCVAKIILYNVVTDPLVGKLIYKYKYMYNSNWC